MFWVCSVLLYHRSAFILAAAHMPPLCRPSAAPLPLCCRSSDGVVVRSPKPLASLEVRPLDGFRSATAGVVKRGETRVHRLFPQPSRICKRSASGLVAISPVCSKRSRGATRERRPNVCERRARSSAGRRPRTASGRGAPGCRGSYGRASQGRSAATPHAAARARPVERRAHAH